MLNLGKLAFDLISGLIWDVIKDGLKSSSIDFFQERKIKSRVEDATAEVIKDVLPFLEQEKIPLEKQQRLIETCVNELKPFSENPAELFKGSLDGQKIFDALYHDKELPQVIKEDGLKDIYSLLFPRIATLLCKIPAAVKDWENEAWSENYRRFDEVVAQLKALFTQVDELASAPQKGADKTLTLFKRTLTQKIGLQLDITGLRADKPLSGKFDDFFVLPEIKQTKEEKGKESISIAEPNDCFCAFTTSGCLAVVIGAPGAGKSTWSKWLQRETLKADWGGIGIRVEFRDLRVDELPSIYDLVRKEAGKQLTEDLTTEKIRKWLEDGKLAFIFDGFDEIRPTDRNKFIEWIKEINEFARGCPFIITSRPLTTDHLESFGGNWQPWMIEPFDEKRIITYISKWYANTPLLNDRSREINAEGLAGGWQRDPTLKPLTGNPLLLSTLLMVHHLDGKLPNGRANLYKRYVDGMLGIWDDRHKLIATDIQINPEEKRKIVRGIALNLFLAEQETIDENMLLEWLDGFLPKVSISASAIDVLTVLRERSGLIVGPGIYSFAHKTIAEYLVAEAILQGDQQDKFGKRIDRFHLFKHRNDDRWNTVLFLWAGLAAFIDMNSFVDECVKDKNWELVYGLFLDQYERFPFSERRELLQNLKLIGDDQEIWSEIMWGFDRYDLEIKMPDIRLRGLSEDNTIYNLIIRSIRDKTLVWKEISDAKGKVYDMIWPLAVSAIHDLDSWSEVISSDFPKVGVADDWKRRIAEIIIFDRRQFEMNKMIAAYRKAFPDFFGYIYLVVIDYSVKLLSYYRNEINVENKNIRKQNISEAFEFLLNDDADKAIPFILETKNWQRKNQNTRDVFFKSFLASSKHACDERIIDESAEKKIKKMINRLIRVQKTLSIKPKAKKSSKSKLAKKKR